MRRFPTVPPEATVVVVWLNLVTGGLCALCRVPGATLAANPGSLWWHRHYGAYNPWEDWAFTRKGGTR